ncbi:GerAB/ArcD/ProY family transporter [Metabacillus sp. SLBN-84]
MNHKLTEAQLFLLNISFVTGSSILMAPGLTAAYARNDAWLSMLFALGAGLLLNVFFLLCLKQFHYASIFSVMEQAAGRYAGTVINIIIIFYSLHLAAYVVRNLSNFMTTSISPEASSFTFQAAIILISLYSVYFGANNLARVNQFYAPIVMMLLFFSFILVINQFDFSNLKPVLYRGIKPVWSGAYTTIGFPFLEMLLLFSLTGYMSKKKNIPAAYLFSLFTGGIILVLIVLFSIGIQGYDLVQRQTYSTFELMRDIDIIDLLERVEVLIGIAWIFGIFVKITICFLCAMLGFQSISRHPTYRPFLLPAGVFVFVLSNGIHENIISFSDFVSSYWTIWWFALYLLLTLTMIAGILFKRHTKTLN